MVNPAVVASLIRDGAETINNEAVRKDGTPVGGLIFVVDGEETAREESASGVVIKV